MVALATHSPVWISSELQFDAVAAISFRSHQ